MDQLSKSVRDHLMHVSNAPNIEALWDLHTQKMAQYGFDRLLYGFTYGLTPTSLGDPNDFLLLTNHDSSYTDGFVGQGYYQHSTMLKWALENEGACSWRMMAEMMKDGGISQQEQRLMELNQSMNVLTGYTLSFKAVSARSKGAIALTGRADMSQDDVDDVWTKHGQEITIINNMAHLKILTLPYANGNQTLTKRQREALEWVGDGKTMQDIAVIMGLTQATVEKHLRLAREALNVETTAQAVLKAAFQNQMFVLDV